MAEGEKRIVTIGIKSIDEAKQRASKAFQTGVFPGYGIFFLSIELMWKVLAPKRWDILKAMVGQEPMSTREVARRVGRDVKAVYGDVKALRLTGILDRTEDGKVVFPYDEIHVDFSIRPGAETLVEATSRRKAA